MKIVELLVLVGLATPAAAQALTCTALSQLRVDADGAPDSYRVDGKGLSYTCDGVFAVVDGVPHTQINDKAHWQALCKEHWARAQSTNDYSQVKVVGFEMGKTGPVVQGPGDPLPGLAYVTATSLRIAGTPAHTQRQYVNASEIPYVVIGHDYATTHGLKLGDLVLLYRPMNNRVAYAVYAECCSLGEGSIRLHRDLGSDPIAVETDGTRRARRNIEDPLVMIPLQGVHATPTLDEVRWRQEIKTKGDAALAAIGGLTAVKNCTRKPD